MDVGPTVAEYTYGGETGLNQALLHPRRRLALEGAYNVRDLGAYPTQDGRRTRWGKFLRADGLHALTGESQDALIGYGVRTAVDLRLTREVEFRANALASRPEVSYHQVNVLGDEYLEADVPEIGEPADRLVGIYTTVLDKRQPALRRVLGLLAGSGSSAAMYNCTAGKDRTGIVSALLLGLAGVPHEIIVEDYALSARFLLERYLHLLEAGEMTTERPLEEITWQTYRDEFCPQSAMRRVLTHLDDRYDGVEGYVCQIGVTQAEIEAIRTSLVD